MHGRIAGVLVVAACAIAFPAGALAAAPGTMNPAGKIRGVVPAHGQKSKHPGNNNLSYHGGPVMHVNEVYAIYWFPPGSTYDPSYQSVINTYFGDVAAASGQTSNVYYSDTQYYDSTGSIQYSSIFGRPIVDTNPFPASGCRDRYTSICLTDGQLQTEIENVITANKLSPNLSTEFFMFTPNGVGSCAGSSCAFSYYCAYHSQIGTGSNAVLYANLPYAMTVPSACGSGESPNGSDADSTINVASHEHNETITDPLGTAWFDNSGNEDGDKCAWNFGSPLGGAAGAEYNQVINRHDYYLQQEWSNASSGCVLTGI
jgi:hypothetical protein